MFAVFAVCLYVERNLMIGLIDFRKMRGIDDKNSIFTCFINAKILNNNTFFFNSL